MTTPWPGAWGTAGQFEQFRLQDHGLQQGVDAFAGLRGYLDELHRAAPILRDHVERAQLVLDPLRVGRLQVHLVHRDNERNIGCLGVLNRFLRLRHHAIVRRHNQDHHVRGLGTPRPHGREGGMAGRVDERNLAVLGFDVVGADVLGDSTGLAGNDAGMANVVEERRLAVIDVAHDGDHGRARVAFAFDLQRLLEIQLNLVVGDELDLVAHLLHQQNGGILVEDLVDRGHDTHAHQGLDRLAGLDAHALSQFADGGHFADFHLPDNDLLGFLELAALFLHGEMASLGPPRFLLQRQLATTNPAVAEVVLPGAAVAMARCRPARCSTIAALRGAGFRLHLGRGFRRRPRDGFG